MITFRSLKDTEKDYKQLHKWCSKDYVYEWFEQRILSYDEIVNKYQKKLNDQIQKLFIIKSNNKDIGLVQIYKYDEILDNYKNVYEYDIFIGEEDYLNKGIGKKVIAKANEMIYKDYHADAIILRPFKRNIRAIKCYKKCGFKHINDYDGFDTLGNPEVISVLIKEQRRYL